MPAATATAPKLELVDIDALEPNPANPNEGDIGAICDLIVHNGWFGQTLVQARDGQPDRVFVGEHRWRALRLLQAQGGVVRENGTETTLDYAALRARAEALDLPALPPAGKCWVQRYAISDRLARRHMLADNRAHDLASYDDQQLAAILREIADEDGLVGTGFDDEALDELLRDLAADEAKNRPRASDDAPPRPENPITKPGDLIVLGEHRLLCGDSRDPDSFARLLGDERADMVWTDPPYGVEYGEKNRFLQTIGPSDRLEEDIAGDGRDPVALGELLADVFGGLLKFTRPGAVWFVAAPPGPPLGVFATELLKTDVWRQLLCWVKNRPIFGRSDYHYQHENLFYGWTPGAAHTPPPTQSTSSLWEFDSPSASKLHPTMKPIGLVVAAIQNHSAVGDLVLDPFSGSGTTLMACEQEARVARVIELDSGYADVTVERWEKHTGQEAVRP